MEWISAKDRLPEIAANTEQEFIVAIKRAHNGKTYVMAANYLNALMLIATDSDGDERPFTGWYKLMTSDGEFDTCWWPQETDGDVVTHWQFMPLPPIDGTQTDEPSALEASANNEVVNK